MRDAPLLIEPKIRLPRKISYAPFRKELRRGSLPGRFISDVLRAFFAKFKMRTLAVRLRPGAAGTIDSVLLIELQQRASAPHNTHLTERVLRGGNRGGHATGRFADRFDLDGRRFFGRLSAQFTVRLAVICHRISQSIVV